MRIRHAWLVPMFSVVLLGWGCAPKNKDMLEFLRAKKHHVSAIEYRVGVPDRIQISAPRVEEIDGKSHIIQPDGKVTLKLLGDIKVTDMTAKEIASKLQVQLARYYVDPKVSVKVTGFNSKKYYVVGPTVQSGPRPYTGRDTLIDAVLESGADFRAWKQKVKIVRPAHGDTPVREITVDVNRMVEEGDWRSNVLLEPDDVVNIPPTPLAWVGLKIRELLQPVGPALNLYLTPADVGAAQDVYENDGSQPGLQRQIRRNR